MANVNFVWPNGCKAAVSLTYDDAVPVHHQTVAPQLDKAGIKGTFYTDIRSLMRQDPEPWRDMALRGHELGNHSLMHPCFRTEGNKSWLQEWRDLAIYSLERWKAEAQVASYTLFLIDGKTERTFGNSCCENEVGPKSNRKSFDPIIAKLFVAGRGKLTRKIVNPIHANLANLGCFGGDGRKAADIIREIEQAVQEGGWYVLMLHGVGEGNHNLHIKQSEHDALVEYLAGQKGTVWCAPLVEVGKHVRERQGMT